jgi:GntR family transcriptional regulator / MocR family aminotransferase
VIEAVSPGTRKMEVLPSRIGRYLLMCSLLSRHRTRSACWFLFICSGAYELHLRCVRRRNAARREVLLESIRNYLGVRIEVTGDGPGAQIILWPKQRVSEQEVIAKATARGVGISWISRYYLESPSRTGLMLGYCRMTEAEIREGVRRLGEIL